MKEFFNTLIEALNTAGDVLLKHYGNLTHIEYKGEVNPVTAADKESEGRIIEIISRAFPSHKFLAEETAGDTKASASDFLWIIDPLDGTVNFSHSLPIFSVSIALMIDGELKMGGVYNPINKETFSSICGEGAFLNGKKIQTSKIDKLGRSLLSTGFPYDRWQRGRHYCEIFEEFIKSAQCVRRLGSAALDLCSVACGRLEGFWEEKLAPWDTAAGCLILEEAGGISTDFKGQKYSVFTPFIVASNTLIHNEMIDITRRFI